MANEKQINYICTIQRGLGIVEGIASGISDTNVAQLLYTATQMIEESVEAITDGK